MEKILEPGEDLPESWRTAGTTGYDALAEVDDLLVDPAGEEALTALTRADAAGKAWARTTARHRSDVLHRAYGLLIEQKDRLALVITREMGKPLSAAEGEVDFAADITEFYADNAEKIMKDQPIDILGEGTAVIRRSALGVLLGIMPWNFPYYQVARFAAPNLMIGNTIVLKHAPQCPESAAAMEQIFRDAGFPADAYLNVYASNEQVADIIADPRNAGVSVTGSERAGSAVAEIAGRNLKKVILYLMPVSGSCSSTLAFIINYSGRPGHMRSS